eukprot:scaffold7139_cov100-Amphora_coffeaeformis.AAC.8
MQPEDSAAATHAISLLSAADPAFVTFDKALTSTSCNPSSWHPASAPPPRPTATPSSAKLQPVDGVSPSSTPTSGATTSTGSATAMPSRPLPPIRDPATNSVAGPRNSLCTIGPQSIAPPP